MPTWKRGTLVAVIAVAATLFLVASPAWAVPSLGVATNNAYSDGIGGSPLEAYQAFFADPDTSVSGSGFEGFLIGPSGDSLIVFTNVLSSDIWLLTDTTTFDTNSPITFDGQAFALVDGTGQFDGYKPTPYYGVNLGPVNTMAGWVALPANPFEPDPFFMFEAPLTYAGGLLEGTYFFAAADSNNCAELQANSNVAGTVCGQGFGPDPFSPRTTSAVAVPEPGALVQTLGGLLVLAAATVSRRRFLVTE